MTNARPLCEKLGVENKNEEIREAMSLADIYARKTPDEQMAEDSDISDTDTKKNIRVVKRSKNEIETSSSLYA